MNFTERVYFYENKKKAQMASPEFVVQYPIKLVNHEGRKIAKFVYRLIWYKNIFYSNFSQKGTFFYCYRMNCECLVLWNIILIYVILPIIRNTHTFYWTAS